MIPIHPDDTLFEACARIAAAQIAGCTLEIVKQPGMDNEVTAFLSGRYGKDLLGEHKIVEMSDEQIASRIGTVDRIRYGAAERVPETVYQAAAETGFYIARTPVYMEGRLELLQYFKQQAICDSYHRYGNLGERSME